MARVAARSVAGAQRGGSIGGWRRAAVAVAASLVVGCSTADESPVPVACKSTPETVRRALRDAPRQVSLDGTPISDCFTRASDPGEIQAVGIAFTEAAADLSGAARANPEGDAALQLGYLVGAVREGASETQGIHDELARRVEQELAGVDTSSGAFATGERAGRESG